MNESTECSGGGSVFSWRTDCFQMSSTQPSMGLEGVFEQFKLDLTDLLLQHAYAGESSS